MRFLIFISILFGLYSCADINKRSQLKELENVDQTIDSLLTILEDSNTDEFMEMLSRTKVVYKRIEANFPSDSIIDLDFALKLDEYKSLIPGFSSVIEEDSSLTQLLARQRVRIIQLRKDIENGNGKRQKYPSYIQYERNSVNTYKAETEIMQENIEKYQQRFRELHNEIEQFSLSLSSPNVP